MKKLLVFVFLLMIYTPSYAFFEMDIKKLTMQNGLADNTVSAIIKDNDGFIWFGTENGLSRYDGKRIRNFYLNNSYTNIKALANGSDGILWTVVNGGLYYFDRKREKFGQPKSETLFENVESQLIVNDSFLWLITGNRLCRLEVDYHTNSNFVSIINIDKYDYQKDNNTHQLLSINKLDDNTIIASTNRGEFSRIDQKTGEIIASYTINDLNGTYISSVAYNAHDNQLWLGTWTKGLFILDLDSGKYKQYAYSTDPHKNISHTDIYGISQIDNERFVSVGWNGYTLFTPGGNDKMIYNTKVYNNTASHIHRNIETHMISVYYDPNGILWIGTLGGGVFATDLRKQFYKQYFQDRHNEICAIAHNNNDEIFLGTYHKGLMKSVDKVSRSTDLEFISIHIPELQENVLAIAQDENNLWLGGNQPYLVNYNTTTKKHETYYPNSDKNILGGDIRSILKSDSKTLWIGARNLVRFDIELETFEEYNLNCTSIRSIVKDENGNLWLGSNQGIIKFDPKTGESKTGYEIRQGMTTRIIKSLIISSDQLYIGYDNGLSIFDIPADSIIKCFSALNGLNNNYIGTIVEDNNSQIWIGSNSGISRYSKSQGVFYHYYISGSNRASANYNNTLYWGNNINLSYFHPTDLESQETPEDKVLMTMFEIDGKEVDTGKKVNGQIVLDKSIALEDTIILKKKNNSFSLSFSNLKYDDIQKYKYRLTPYNRNWTIAEEGERVSYAFLDKGEYIFEVKSILHNGDEGNLSELYIKVLPDWYERFWFRLLVALFLIGSCIFTIKKVKEKNLRKAREQSLKDELLIAAMENEREKKINRERNIFFTNVSHELRTPLTLIQGPLESIITREDIPAGINKDLKRVYTNAKSLSNMVDRLLYLQKAESGSVKLQIVLTDIISLSYRVIDLYKQLAEKRNIAIRMVSSTEKLMLWIDEEKIEIVLQNLLTNALKYTDKAEDIIVNIDTEFIDNTEYCKLSVIDTGIGIEEEFQHKIFDPFVVGSTQPTFSTQTGIGLRIVKSTIEQHHGQVLLQSQKGKGSTFTILIPLGSKHYNTDNFAIANNKKTTETNESIVTSETKEENENAENKVKKITLLIIEDNSEMREYIKDIFLTEYNVIVAINGEQGITKAISEQPDIILTDIMMPVKDGYEVAKEIKKMKETAHIPVLMLTAKAEDHDMIKGLNIGADDYIAKPFNPQLLQAKIKNMTQARQQLKRLYTKSLMIKDETSEELGSPLMQEIVNIIELHISDPDFSVKNLAESLNMSQSTLYRRITEHSDLSAKDIIRNIRISKAALLILKKEYQIQEVAYMVGYNDLSSFRKHFVNQFGVNPSDFSNGNSVGY